MNAHSGVPVALKTWWGHQYRLGIICRIIFLFLLTYLSGACLPNGPDVKILPHHHSGVTTSTYNAPELQQGGQIGLILYVFMQ